MPLMAQHRLNAQRPCYDDAEGDGGAAALVSHDQV
jgi:hypothetical protein